MAQEPETLGVESASQSTGAPQTLLSPFCRELRSKKYYFLNAMPTEESQILDASAHCWCSKTMRAFGPDGELVQPSDCAPGRNCYKSLFAED
jgi:hypothetical protein